MKAFTLTLLIAATASSAALAESTADVVRLSEPVAVTATHEIFGAPLDASQTAMTLDQLVAAGDQYLEQEVTVTTEITQVCQKKGCFFIARDADAVARISFKDYSFFIPTDAAGKVVTLTGIFNRQSVTQEQADHYAEDLGVEAAPAPDFEYAIVASAVSIPKG